MTEEQEEFRQMMKQDEYQEKADIAHEIKMRNDYDFFREYNEDVFTAFIDAHEELKKLHKQMDHEFYAMDLL